MLRKISKSVCMGAVLVVLCFTTFAAESPAGPLELSLNEAILRATKQHSDVRKAELDLKISQLELEVAKAEFELPSIDVGISSPKLTGEGLTGDLMGSIGADLSLLWGAGGKLSANLSGSLSTDDQLEYAWRLSCSHTLDLADLNQLAEGLKTKEEAVQQAQVSLEEARTSIILETIDEFSQLIVQKSGLDQARLNLEDAQRNLEKVKGLVEEGIKGEMALMEARLNLLDSQIEVEEKRSAYQTAVESFGRRILGTEEDFTLIAPQFPLDELKKAASNLLAKEDLIEEVAKEAPEVNQAKKQVSEAKENLEEKKRDILPVVGIEASLDSKGMSAGVGVSFDLLAPTRTSKVQIAASKLELKEEQLKITMEMTRDEILTNQTSLQGALNKLARLSTEEEKLELEEKVKKAKYEAGTISENDWEEFQEEKGQFLIDAQSRKNTLLKAYLRYRASLGLELNWKEWLK